MITKFNVLRSSNDGKEMYVFAVRLAAFLDVVALDPLFPGKTQTGPSSCVALIRQCG